MVGGVASRIATSSRVKTRLPPARGRRRPLWGLRQGPSNRKLDGLGRARSSRRAPTPRLSCGGGPHAGTAAGHTRRPRRRSDRYRDKPDQQQQQATHAPSIARDANNPVTRVRAAGRNVPQASRTLGHAAVVSLACRRRDPFAPVPAVSQRTLRGAVWDADGEAAPWRRRADP